jgi:N-methylhydantoinase B
VLQKVNRLDPITYEVVQNGLDSIVDEMALTITRTGFSTIVRDVLDFATALCDREGQMIAQGLTTVVHLGSFPDPVKCILSDYSNSIFPGDVFILNDPYGSGGIHLPDIYVIKPIFVDNELEAFSCVVAHHSDVGGRVPGSMSTEATELCQEGLCLPTLKLYERGVPNEAIFAIIQRNVRVPVAVLGDLRAEIAAALIGERHYQRLATKYGASTMRQYTSAFLDNSEALARREIGSWPDGSYEFTDYLDGDAIADGEPVVINVVVKIDGERVTVTFPNTSAQVKAGINSPLTYTKSAVYGAVRLALGADLPNAAGYFRVIDVMAPEGTVVYPRPGAPCGARGIVGFRVMDAVLGALAKVVPGRVPADGEGGCTTMSFGGFTADFRPFVYVDSLAGSRGGRPSGDAPEAVPHPMANQANTPIEIVEASLPIRIEEYGLATDACGAGQFRGALAINRNIRNLAPDAVVQFRSDKRRFLPYPLAGGRPGTPSSFELVQGGERLPLPTMGALRIEQNALLVHTTAGGGGWGDPLKREVAAVHADVWNEKLSIANAEREYGVVIDPITLKVDNSATQRLRSERSSTRG